MMIVEGVCQTEITVRWLCTSALVVVPVTAAVLLRSRGVAATPPVALAGVTAIGLTLPTRRFSVCTPR